MQTSTVTELWNRQRAGGLANLSGTHLDVQLPVRQGLLDRWLATSLKGRAPGGLRVHLRSGNRLRVDFVKPIFGFNARAGLDLRLQPVVALATDTRVFLLVDRPGLAWAALSRLVVAAGLAPAGVEVARDGIAVDLAAVATRSGVADLLAYVQSIEFDGREGVLWTRIAIHVPAERPAAVETPTPPAGPPATGGPSAGSRRMTVDALMPHLAGARVAGRVAVHQRLVNDAVQAWLHRMTRAERPSEERGAAHAGSGMGRPGDPDEPGSRPIDENAPNLALLLPWLRQVRVGFDTGRMLVDVQVEIPGEGILTEAPTASPAAPPPS